MSLENDVLAVQNATYGRETRVPIVDALMTIENQYTDYKNVEIITTKFSDFGVQENLVIGDYTLIVNPTES